MTIRVALVDDQALFRAGIAMLIDSQPDLEVVGEAGDGSEVSGAGRDVPPGRGADGRADERHGRGHGHARAGGDVRRPRTEGARAHHLRPRRGGGLGDRGGASGFVLKGAEPEFLLASVRAVAAGNQVVAAGATRALWERFRARPTRTPGPEYAALTGREREILLRAAQGLSNAEIAAAEVLAEGTVKTHISRILSKLGLRDRVQLVVYAYEHGLA